MVLFISRVLLESEKIAILSLGKCEIGTNFCVIFTFFSVKKNCIYLLTGKVIDSDSFDI